MGSEWCGDLPAVVVFVDVFVYKFVVKEAVDPVNTGISEHNETHNAEQNVTPVTQGVGHCIIQFTVTSDLNEE